MKVPLIIAILLGLGIIMVLSGMVAYAGEKIDAFFESDGQKISCSVMVDATPTGTLVVEGTPVCQHTGSCDAPSRSIIPGQVEGQLGVWQSGTLYATKAVSEHRFGGGDAYGITACIPAEATQVRIGTINSNAGLDHDVLVNIQEA